MIGFIFGLTLRQLAFRKSTLALIALAAIPVLLALVFRLSDPDTEPERWVATVLVTGLIVTAVLPLTALLLGTTAIGDEIEDGTAVYLLTKPIPRWQILVPKIGAAWLLTAALVLVSTVLSCLIALEDGSSLTTAFAVAVVIGAFAYVLLFVALSVTMSRALITGLIYVFIWEGAITGIFRGTRYLSIRHNVLGIADSLADVSNATFNAYVGGNTAIVLLAIVVAVCAYLANRNLKKLELREPT